MTTDLKELKSKFLELLKSDEEFRYVVAGFIGLDQVLNELKKLREDFNKLYQKSLEHDKRFEKIEKTLVDHGKRLSRIELELGALNESFYCKALLDDLREEFRERGEKIVSKKRNARIDNVDIDLLIVTDKRVYVVEAKVKPKHEDIGALLVKADLVKKHYRDREIMPILAGALISREVENYAVEKNIKVYSY